MRSKAFCHVCGEAPRKLTTCAHCGRATGTECTTPCMGCGTPKCPQCDPCVSRPAAVPNETEQTEMERMHACFAHQAPSEQVKHLWEDADEVAKIFEEIPTDHYYAELGKWFAKQFPDVSPGLVEHLVSVERVLDIAICAGISFKLSKLCLAFARVMLLGERVGREGREPDERKVDQIQDWPSIDTFRQLQEFLGTTNFVRHFLGITYAAVIHPLRRYLTKAVDFPLSPRSLSSVEEVKKLAMSQVLLFVPDFAAAMSGERPFVQIADCCGYALGGVCTQVSVATPTIPSTTQPLSFKTKGLSTTQMVWPAWEQEQLAQVICRRFFKVQFQSI